MSAWMRRNRVGLALLPVALLAAAAGNGSRFQTWFWEKDLRVATTAGTDGVVRFVDMYDDGVQQYPIRPTLKLVGVERATTVQSSTGKAIEPKLAAGTVLYKVTIHVEADPNMILVGCRLALADADGTRWNAADKAFDDGGSFSSPSPCTPSGRPGPSWMPNTAGPVVKLDAVRPPAYDVTTYLSIPATANPTQVLVWWHQPRYAVLPITSAH